MDPQAEKARDMARIISGAWDPPPSLVEGCRARLPHDPTPGFQYAEDVRRLLAMLREPKPYEIKKGDLRLVGASLWVRGGFSAMSAVAMEVRWQFPDGEKKPAAASEYLDWDDDEAPDFLWHPQYLDFAWNGIGSWRA